MVVGTGASLAVGVVAVGGGVAAVAPMADSSLMRAIRWRVASKGSSSASFCSAKRKQVRASQPCWPNSQGHTPPRCGLRMTCSPVVLHCSVAFYCCIVRLYCTPPGGGSTDTRCVHNRLTPEKDAAGSPSTARAQVPSVGNMVATARHTPPFRCFCGESMRDYPTVP